MSANCTGLTASWCPIHGDCTCPRRAYNGIYDGDFVAMDDPGCPLHKPNGPHPIIRRRVVVRSRCSAPDGGQ